MNYWKKYQHWLHGCWPFGGVEKLPVVHEFGKTNIKGIRIVGDLSGIPLLKFSADSGFKAIHSIMNEKSFQFETKNENVLDIAIIGGGISGISAAIEAHKNNLDYCIYEASSLFSTIYNFPKNKPIFTYPTEMKPDGDLQFQADIKEDLLNDLKKQLEMYPLNFKIASVVEIKKKGSVFQIIQSKNKNQVVALARRVIIAIGRSGNYRRLGVPGENLNKVSNRLHDPAMYKNKHVCVIGGGDTALETASALVSAGSHVTLTYRQKEFFRAKPENIERIQSLVQSQLNKNIEMSDFHKNVPQNQLGNLNLMMDSEIESIDEKTIRIKSEKKESKDILNDFVFTMIGREAPLNFFRRSGIKIQNEMSIFNWMSFFCFFCFCSFIYFWKSGGVLTHYFKNNEWFPFNVVELLNPYFYEQILDKTSLLGTLAVNLSEPSFYYSTIYCLCVLIFGIRRIKKRKTPYIRKQTISLILFQWIPLFILPYFLLPYLGNLEIFNRGVVGWIWDQLFPLASNGYSREYWRSFGFILAWPLFIWNLYTEQPLWIWLGISIAQTFVIIPWIVYKWGKGAYCGWICSCGALAETLGDAHRQKMPHGPFWNRLNMLGQIILFFCFSIFFLRLISWIFPNTVLGAMIRNMYYFLLNIYYVGVDIFLAGVVGVSCYFWFSGRIWCRFACPLAALMHIYARFSKYRIFSNKKKCISCNVCTAICHQGIDVMGFANKGIPMQDPECVRCSACVEQCPTGTLTFGSQNNGQIYQDQLLASPVHMKEKGE